MSLKLKIEGQIVEISKKFIETSDLLTQQVKPESDEVFELGELITLKIFDIIRKYYEFNNFAPKIIERIERDPSVTFFNEHDKELIMPFHVFEGDDLKQLISASSYLQLTAFRKFCLARIATEFYLDKDQPNKSLNDLKKRLHLDNLSLTLADVERHRELYEQLVQNFS